MALGRDIRAAARCAALVLLLLALPGCSLLPTQRARGQAQTGPTPTPIPPPVVPRVPTYEVQRGEVVRQLEFTGRIAPVVEQELFFRSAGRVRRVYVELNAQITEGQLLADLEIGDLEREMEAAGLERDAAQARLEAAERDREYAIRRAQVNLEIARLNLERAQAQAPPDTFEVAIKEQELALAEIELEVLERGLDPQWETDVERAEARAEALEAAVADAQLVAPFEGQLLSMTAREGAVVEAFEPVSRVADPSELEVSAELISSQLQELAEGMAATITLVSRPGEEIQGTLRRLPDPYGTGGSGDEGAGTDSSARVALDATAVDAGFELGDLARVLVVLERKEDALWLPPQAVRTFEGRSFVVVQEGEAQRRVDVEAGIRVDDRVEIVEGLSAGQTVVGQ
ncbi:MAG TPA: efflux RND transporter periplasmic adaptor subunit [Ardenticatenaceae bacterium]|nr:efflux RND transporter periplasmic adaptor subunit [Ardenticatenaceae bacterium]